MITQYTKQQQAHPSWIAIDASNLIIGRLAVFIANYLRGKNSPTFTAHVNPQNKIIVTNSDLLEFSGNKMQDKIYYHHTGYVGGIKGITAQNLKIKDSTLLLRESVRRMLPDNKLRKLFLRNLYIYKDSNHKHTNHSAELVKFHELHKTHAKA